MRQKEGKLCVRNGTAVVGINDLGHSIDAFRIVFNVLFTVIIQFYVIEGCDGTEEVCVVHAKLVFLVSLMCENFKYFLWRAEEADLVFVITPDSVTAG